MHLLSMMADLVQSMLREGWGSLCQAREDTDGDGITNVSFGHHGAISGDAMVPYLSFGGEGEPLPKFIGRDATGDWVAVVRPGHRDIELLNTRNRTLRSLAEFGLDEEVDSTGDFRSLAFASEGQRLLMVPNSQDN